VISEILTAESSILGSALIDPMCVPVVCGEMAEDDFTNTPSIEIFRSIFRLYSSGVPVDLVTLATDLDKTGKLNSAGGIEHITDLVSGVPTSANIRAYIEIVKDGHRRRVFASGMRNALSLAEDGDDGYIELAKASVDAASAIGSGATELPADYFPEVLNRLGDNGAGVMTGFHKLDAVTLGFQAGNLIILAARPSIGKSSIARNMITNIARRGGVTPLFSLEMTPVQVVSCMCLTEAGVDKYQARRNENSAIEKIMDAQETMKSWRIPIDPRRSMSAGQIVAQCFKLKQRYKKIDCVFIDYLQLIRRPSRKNPNTPEELGEITRALKLAAGELDCPIVLLCQLNRESAKKGRPTIDDLKGSGHIEEDADVVLLLHREQEPNSEAVLIIGKDRDGAKIDIPLVWDEGRTLYREKAFETVHVPKDVFPEQQSLLDEEDQ